MIEGRKRGPDFFAKVPTQKAGGEGDKWAKGQRHFPEKPYRKLARYAERGHYGRCAGHYVLGSSRGAQEDKRAHQGRDSTVAGKGEVEGWETEENRLSFVYGSNLFPHSEQTPIGFCMLGYKLRMVMG